MAHTRPPVWAIVASALGLLLFAVALFELSRGPEPALVRPTPLADAAPRSVRAGLAGAGRSAAPAPPPTTVATAPPAANLVPHTLRIPAIGVNTPLIGLGLNADNTIQVPTDFSVAGWYIYRPTPGEIGPSVIAGHVDSRRGPAVFYRLKDLMLGATVEVERSDGSVAFFTVTGREEVDKNHFPTDRVYGPTPRAELRMITCGGAFNWSTRHYTDNLIVFATLQRIVA